MPSRLELGDYLALIWIAAVFLVSLLSAWLTELNLFVALLLLAGSVLLGLALLMGLLLPRSWRATAILLAGGLATVLIPVGEIGLWGWSRISLEQDLAAYEAVVREASSLPQQGEAHGVAYIIEVGPPLRVAFPVWHGLPDGLSAVVHDPSRTVGGLEGADSYLFGDEIHSCVHLVGPWHRCWLD